MFYDKHHRIIKLEEHLQRAFQENNRLIVANDRLLMSSYNLRRDVDRLRAVVQDLKTPKRVPQEWESN